MDNRENGSKPARPVCLASQGPNGYLSEILSTLTEKVADSYNKDTECLSTEDMCAAIEKLNEVLAIEEDDGDCEIGSMDAKALYPSLKVKETSKICYEMMKEAPIDIKSIK